MMFWSLLASFVAFAVFMVVLALGMMLGRRKTECSCKTTARVMAAKAPQRKNDGSPFPILDNDAGGGCPCGDERSR
ncbi:MAG: hypothetical protein JW888_04775 [Pirellulales bacterium]|nr:hypothetical protein [Pirellulales bacterium]